jgi:hypothetical protein
MLSIVTTATVAVFFLLATSVGTSIAANIPGTRITEIIIIHIIFSPYL